MSQEQFQEAHDLKLDVYGIVISLQPRREADGSVSVGGSIVSELAAYTDVDKDDESLNEPDYKDGYIEGRIDGLEALILACACSGVDVQSPEFLEAIETAVDAISNQE